MNTSHFKPTNMVAYTEVLSRLDAVSAEVADIVSIVEASTLINDAIEEQLLTIKYIVQKKLGTQSTQENSELTLETADSNDNSGS